MFKVHYAENSEFRFSLLRRHLKPGLHIVVRIAEHACDDTSKRILKFLIH